MSEHLDPDQSSRPGAGDLPSYHRTATEGAAPTAAPAADPGWSPPPADRPDRARRGAGVAALVLAGALIGGAAVAAVTHGSSGGTAASAQVGAGQGSPGQLGGSLPGQGGAAGPGGLAGEQRVTGTLRSVGSSSIQLSTADGTSTYPVTSATEIIQDGTAASLADLKSGETVLVHLVPTGTGSAMTVERIIAGDFSRGGFGAVPGSGSGSASGSTT
jgi:hypothetical protein